jgi:hypothetical protein
MLHIPLLLLLHLMLDYPEQTSDARAYSRRTCDPDNQELPHEPSL